MTIVEAYKLDQVVPAMRGPIFHDPVIKATVEVAEALLTQTSLTVGDRVGMITYGRHASTFFADKVRNRLASTGRVSPLDFVNANSGAPISVVCTQFRLRGPTLNFVSGGHVTRSVVDLLAWNWIRNGYADAIIIVEFDRHATGSLVRGSLHREDVPSSLLEITIPRHSPPP